MIQRVQTVDFEKLLVYDTSVYGTPRHTFVEKWINIPGSLGWAAVNKKGDVLGYTAVHQIITDRGTDIQLCIAPLYADNDSVAKVLMKVAVEQMRPSLQAHWCCSAVMEKVVANMLRDS